MLGNTCSAKLKVPADLPFTEQGAHPLLCTAHGTEQEPAVSISQMHSGRQEVLPRFTSLHPAVTEDAQELWFVGVHYRG